VRQLTSLDVQFLAVEDGRNYGHVSSLAILDPSTAPGGVLTADHMIEVLAARLHLLPPFRWKLVEVPLGLDLPYWIDDADFDLEYHVRELALPAPGDDRQLAEQAARIHARPLDRAHPLWELYVIQGVAGGRVAMFTKIHHAAIDGVSGAEILSVMLDPSPEGRDMLPATRDDNPEQVPGQLSMLGRGLAGLPRAQMRAARAVPQTLAHLDSIPGVQDIPGAPALARMTRRIARIGRAGGDGGILEAPRSTAPRTSLNGRISSHRRVAFESLSLTDVKDIKSARGVTVNDTVIAICAGAMRTFLQDRGELPDEPLVAMIPVSVRTKEQMGTFGNRVSTLAVPIPTHLDDPIARLQFAHEAMRSAKDHHKAVPASLLQDATAFIPPAIVGRAARVTLRISAREMLAPLFNIVISNVPGSPVPLYCAGAKVLATYPVSAVTHGLGLNITVLSYEDRLDFAVVADRDMVPDPWPLMDMLAAEMEALKAAALTPG
jgi:WS/DGAT/MGAT family acyltransferase